MYSGATPGILSIQWDNGEIEEQGTVVARKEISSNAIPHWDLYW